MEGLDDLMFGLGNEERLELARRQRQFLGEQKKVIGELGKSIESKTNRN